MYSIHRRHQSPFVFGSNDDSMICIT